MRKLLSLQMKCICIVVKTPLNDILIHVSNYEYTKQLLQAYIVKYKTLLTIKCFVNSEYVCCLWNGPSWFLKLHWWFDFFFSDKHNYYSSPLSSLMKWPLSSLKHSTIHTYCVRYMLNPISLNCNSTLLGYVWVHFSTHANDFWNFLISVDHSIIKIPK